MGICFNYGPAHWSYSGFFRFRVKLANAIDFPEYEHITTIEDVRNQKIKDHPLYPFLNHSDCEGDIESKFCLQIANAMFDIIKDWDDNDYDKKTGLLLVDGLKEAYAQGERFEFL